MKFPECDEIIKENFNLIGEFLDENGNLTEEADSAKSIIKDIVIAPSNKGDALGNFWIRYRDSKNFSEALLPFLSDDDLEVNFYAQDLKTGKYGFFPFKDF
jgi:hypothetical protein